MATAKQFLDAIELEKLVPNDLLDELYEKYRASGGAITADALAERLVSIGALSQAKANALLQSPSDSFIQVGSGILNPTRKVEESPDDPFEQELEAKRALAGEKRDASGRRKHVKKTHKNDFDSPLLLLGGGALALLVLGGVGLAVMMSLQSGDQLLESAQSNYASGSYSQARDEYQQFVEDFAGNARWSEARVKLAVVRMRQLIETSSDWSGALAVAQEEIPQIEDEPAFSENRGEFASLLPRIAKGLAEAADKASQKDDGSSERVDGFVKGAQDAMTLIGNTKYVPKSLRDDGELSDIDELLQRVARRREAVADLEKTLATIESATASGNIHAAYAAQDAFVVRRPELREDPRLAEKLAGAVEAERSQLRFIADPADSATSQAPSPVALALPLADPRRSGSVQTEGVFTANFGGVLYAVNAADGALAWRRPVGTRLAETPAVAVESDLMVIDHRRGELLRIKAATGGLVWRAAVEGPDTPLFAPVVVGQRVLVASETGRLWSFDLGAGARSGYAEFAQPLRSAPAGDGVKQKVYVAGEQSSLYTLDADSLECVAVRYTGHSPGTMVTPPLAIGGRVLTIENVGDQSSRLNVYATDEQGVISNQLRDWRLEGIVSTPAVAAGRRVLVTTESGAVYLFEVTSSQDGPPLSLVASRGVQNGPPQRRSVVEARGDVWIAGEGLRRTAASLADSQLVNRDLQDPCDNDSFVGPLTRNGDAVLHARVRKGHPGVTLAASDARSGQLVWETDLAAPPLGAPVYSDDPRGVFAVGVEGQVHAIGPQEARAQLSAKPVVRPPRPRKYQSVEWLGGGEAALAVNGANEWLAVRASPRPAAASISLPGELASPPVAMGGGLLTPLKIGQVCLLDLAGKQLATPFQPRVAVGDAVSWTPPAVADAGGDLVAFLSDGQANVYCLGLDGGDSPALSLRGSHQLGGSQPTTVAVITANRGAVGLAGGALAVYDLPAMKDPNTVTLPGEIAWGPYAAEGALLVATDGKLIAVGLDGDSAILWQADLKGSEPIGKPLIDGGGALVANRDGSLVRYSLADGAETARLDLGEALGSGPTSYGQRWLVASADGTVLVVNRP